MANQKTEMIYKEIDQLTINEKKLLLLKLMMDISPYIARDEEVNIYDIKGIGKEIWHGIDAQDYVNKERASWE